MQKLFVFFVLLLLFSCSKDSIPANPPASNNQVYPIVSGNYWVYRDSSFNDNGSFYGSAPSDTLRTIYSITFQGNVFYGADTFYITQTYYRQADDSTIEEYDPAVNNSYIYFRHVKTNNTIIRSEDVVYSNEHFVTTLTGYTDTTNLYGYDCIRNESTSTRSGILNLKIIIYVKPGVGVVRYEYYLRNTTTGNLNIYFTRTLVSYKVE